MAQKDTNPYIYSDSNKRYMTYDWYMKERFGGKIAKVPLDISLSCPNLDGSKGHGGCIYCQNGSRSSIGESLAEQYENGVRTAGGKWLPVGYIPYLQSNTNTYGENGYLRSKYAEAASLPGAKMLDIATRADCLGDDKLSLLEEAAENIPLTVELGLQTSDDNTAALINRCHSYGEFTEGYGRLRELAEKVNSRFPGKTIRGKLTEKRFTICIHIINGLPEEGRDEMLKTASDVAALAPDMVKIHLLHVLKDTGMEPLFLSGKYVPLERDGYVRTVCDQLEILPPETVIARVTGDGLADSLLAPLWSRRKTEVQNEIDKELYRRGTYEGYSY